MSFVEFVANLPQITKNYINGCIDVLSLFLAVIVVLIF